FRCRRRLFRQTARNRHAKDGFSRTAAYQHDITAMLRGNALCERQSETRPLLLSLAHKRFEKSVAYALRNSVAVIQYSQDDLCRTDIQTHSNACRFAAGVYCLARIQNKVVNGSLDLFSVHDG